MWDLIDQFKLAGRTILLTTHYMDEAERLCDRVAIMDHGKVIALGTPRELIASIGAEQIVEFAVGNAALGLDVAAVRRIDGVRSVRTENGSILMHVSELHQAVPALLGGVQPAGCSAHRAAHPFGDSRWRMSSSL